MNINQAIKNRIIQLYQERKLSPAHLLHQADGNITLDTVDAICAEIQITVADFFNSDLFRNLERN